MMFLYRNLMHQHYTAMEIKVKGENEILNHFLDFFTERGEEKGGRVCRFVYYYS